MSGETGLRTLLSGMRPELNPGRYVFTTVASRTTVHAGPDNPLGATPVVTVAEEEGLTR
ncbi:ACT domain-containing protein [Streptomyces sp. 150FB]|uniref:ACT domain-containing protein n=1 Tax=Streptomyces sp. 150FB TaxID=1576605 RepID=UPI00322163A7